MNYKKSCQGSIRFLKMEFKFLSMEIETLKNLHFSYLHMAVEGINACFIHFKA